MTSPKSAHLTTAKTISPTTDWPVYSVLVPLYDEAQIIPILIHALKRLDYPLERLEILIICEADDHSTIDALRPYLGAPFTLIEVPPSLPRTKPKALNVALKQARGELITIYDAEDRPHPRQLKSAVQAFATHSDWQALQAPLDYFNHNVNWLTRQFALEYGVLFHIWVPFLARLGWPFPLGGTSNHIRRHALDEIGGWDSYNVTEDADLSFRLAANGYKIGHIQDATNEEAVENWTAWQHQRARWIKGFIQTWLIHMSRPLIPGGLKGLIRFATIQITIGGAILAGLIHVPFMLWLGGCYGLSQFEYAVPSQHNWASLSIIFCYGTGIISGIIAALRIGKPKLCLSALFMPLYWWLLFPATLQALYEFLKSPFHWNKTTHGLGAITYDYFNDAELKDFKT